MKTNLKNEYQEALDLIKPTTNDYEIIKASRSIQELVDKETPMKPTTDRTGNEICGKCKEEQVTFDPNIRLERCSSKECGQVVDWGDKNE